MKNHGEDISIRVHEGWKGGKSSIAENCQTSEVGNLGSWIGAERESFLFFRWSDGSGGIDVNLVAIDFLELARYGGANL